MGQDYSYTQPFSSEAYPSRACSDGFSETEDLIRQDQAELDIQRAMVQYPPQPEVEFGFPQICYCGARPLLVSSPSRNNVGRLIYTCSNVDDGDCHVSKWWDQAVMEEMRARDSHTLQLAEKVDYLTGMSDIGTELNLLKDHQFKTDQKLISLEEVVSDLGNNRSTTSIGFGSQNVVALVVIVVVLIGCLMVRA